MATTDKNIIKKQTLDFNYNGNVANVFSFEKEISDWCKQELAQEIELSINTLAPHEKYVHINKLVIDVNVNQQQWKNELTEQIGKQIKEKLQYEISVLTLDENAAVSAANNFFELLKFYLEKGYLPWWSAINTKDVFETELNKWLQQELDDFVSKFLPLLNDNNIRQRIATEFSSRSFILLTAALTKSQPEKIDFLLQDVLVASSNLLSKPSVKNEIYNFRLTLLQKCITATAANILKESIKEWLQQIMHAAKSADKKYVSQLQSEEFISALNEFKVADKPNIDEPDISDKKQTEVKESNQKISEEGIYINNAGLIIIANFLPSFFKKLSLFNDYIITDISAAVCLTNFLANGIEDMAEFELVFPKILCGIQPDILINTSIEISDAAKEEAENLLASVIAHWTILKNTSVEALRQSFLQRNGKLSFKNNEWLLQVEQQPYDMLLKDLPWNIGMIKLSWMPNLLKTEWIN